DVGELEGAPELVRERQALLLPHPEDTNAEAPDRAGDAIAIKAERLEIWGADARDHVHLHAVDDGDEIVAAEAEPPDDVGERVEACRRPPGIERVDIAAPAL